MDRLTVRLTDPDFWRFEYCCFSWELKAGTIISTVIGFTVLMTAFIVTTGLIEDEYKGVESPKFKSLKTDQILHYLLVYLYLLVGLAAFGITFLAILNDMAKLRMIGTFLIIGTFAFWLLLLIPSFIEKFYGKVCIETRCPESHWLMRSRWRDFQSAFKAIDCRKEGKPYGLQLTVIKPPKKELYERWFTGYNIKLMRQKREIYTEWIKKVLSKPKPKPPKARKFDLVIESLNDLTIGGRSENISDVNVENKTETAQNTSVTELIPGVGGVDQQQPTTAVIPGVGGVDQQLPTDQQAPVLAPDTKTEDVGNTSFTQGAGNTSLTQGAGDTQTANKTAENKKVRPVVVPHKKGIPLQIPDYEQEIVPNEGGFEDIEEEGKGEGGGGGGEEGWDEGKEGEAGQAEKQTIISYIPIEKLSIRAEKEYKIPAIILAICWAAFMLHTIVVLAFYRLEVKEDELYAAEEEDIVRI